MTTKSRSRRSSILNESGAFSHSDVGLPSTKDNASTSPNIDPLPADSFFETPPVYTIDLSLPPSQRYVEVATCYRHIAIGLPRLFDVLVLPQSDGRIPAGPLYSRVLCWILLRSLHLITWIFLRGLYSRELTQELRGISRVTGVPMHMLVCFNVAIDLLMGCTSGGVLGGDRFRSSSMLHFRTLDWIMPELRRCIVQFEFREHAYGPVIATSISYVGYVGVLTAVRPGLSVSLNFRPYHNGDDSFKTNAKFRTHQLLVFLGWRPSISVLLRDLILPPTHSTSGLWKYLENDNKSVDPGLAVAPHGMLAEIANHFPSIPTTAAYLTFSDGTSTLVLEKDLRTAKVLQSDSFIVVTNHDTSYEEVPNIDDGQNQHIAHAATTGIFADTMQEMITESIERKASIADRWARHCAQAEERERRTTMRSRSLSRRSKGSSNSSLSQRGSEKKTPCISKITLLRWVDSYPVTNEQTHFATVMDPKTGKVVWAKCFEYVEDKNEVQDGGEKV